MRKNLVWFSHVARAHRWVAPLTNPHGRRWRLDARPCQAPIYLSDTQQQSGTSNPGRPARAVSHPTLNLRKALGTQTPNLTLP